MRGTPFNSLARAQERQRANLPPSVLAEKYKVQAEHVMKSAEAPTARTIIAQYGPEIMSTYGREGDYDELVQKFFTELRTKKLSFVEFAPDEKHERAGYAYALAAAHLSMRQ